MPKKTKSERVAEKIAEDVFTTPGGTLCDYLVLGKDGRQYSSFMEPYLRKLIAEILEREYGDGK